MANERVHAVDIPTGVDEHFARIQGFRARVFDDELRELALEVVNHAATAAAAGDRASADSALVQVGDTHKCLQQRINLMLRELF